MVASRHRMKVAGLLVGIGLACAACSSADTSHNIAVLDAESSTRPVPEVVSSNQLFAQGSARFLGESDGSTYYVAKSALAPDHEVCLIQINEGLERWTSGCSTIKDDRIVVLGSAGSTQEIALVGDDPSVSTLEEAGWEKVADNLWRHGAN